MRLSIYLLALIFFAACSTPPVEKKVLQESKTTFVIDGVSVNTDFAGARMSDFQKVNDSTFRGTILPENTPVNASAWYAFQIWGESKKDIYLELYYPDFQHRFVPKLSHDGKAWTPMNANLLQKDTARHSVLFPLTISKEALWISAQEIVTSADMRKWSDDMATSPFVSKNKLGESVNGQPLHMLEIAENPKATESILLIARQHPPEVPGGTIAMQAFVERVIGEDALAKAFRQRHKVLLMPLVNPDGVDLGNWRHNANGADLNRDWIDFLQPETQQISEWVKDYVASNGTNVRYGIDFHTSYSGPYILVMDTLPDSKPAPLTNQWTEAIALTNPDTLLDARPRSQELPYAYNWMINALDAEAVTYEERDEVPRHIIRSRARLYAEKLMEVLGR